ncbi:hypothetical protein [Nonomuraea sp. NPDC052265]|uniref:hypothetical protein n=1 Tax=Nonomuraea sp. NPDC052265 TaxID=3364374 RepID=UPI0037CB39BC
MLRGRETEPAQVARLLDTATVAEALDLARDTGQSHRIEQLGTIIARIAAIEGDAEGCRDRAHTGLLHLTLGRYEQALRDLAAVTVVFAAPDLIEAAVRAAEAYTRFTAWARAAGHGPARSRCAAVAC